MSNSWLNYLQISLHVLDNLIVASEGEKLGPSPPVNRRRIIDTVVLHGILVEVAAQIGITIILPTSEKLILSK